MSLNKQNVDVIFTKGVNNKTNSQLLLNSELLVLENAVFDKNGEINKRTGYDKLNLQDCAGTAITGSNALMTFGNNELLMSAGSNLYSYSSNLDIWVDKSTFKSASVSLNNIISNTAEQTKMDSCVSGNIVLYAWEDTRGGIRYSVQDIETETYFVSDDVLDASGDTPRCITIGNNLFVMYGSTTNLKFKFVPAGSPCTLTSGTTRTDLHTDHLLEITKIGNLAYCFYKTSTAATGRLIEIKPIGSSTNVQTVTATIIDTLAVESWTFNNVAYLTIAYKQTASLVMCGIYTQSLIEVIAPKTLDSTASSDISKIAIAQTSSLLDQTTIMYQTPGAAVKDNFITSNTLDLDGTVGTPAVFMRSVGLASKMFTLDDILYINVLHESPLQSTVFTLDSSGNTVAKYAAGNAGTNAGIDSFLPSVVDLGAGNFDFVMNIKGQIRSENATIFSRLGLTRASIDLTSQNIYAYTELNNSLFIAGGLLNSYDGDTVVEQGFNVFPEDVSVTSTPATAGSMSDGTYQYAVVYQWIDAKGNTHRSAPSIALTQVLSGGGAAQRVVLSIPTLRITEKQSPRTEVTLEVFRTVTTGSIFYRVSSITAPTNNDVGADTVSYNDTLADASITANEILYTTGGVLDNIAAPSCDLIVTHQNRLFIAGLTNKNEIRYSKITRDGEAPSFNEALSIKVDPKGGDITQIWSMDTNLIIFKKDNLYSQSGNGPSDTGAGATFNEPQLISTDVGCVDPNSVVLGAEGLYFKSAKGIYLLNRSLQTTYIGAPVEDFNGFTIVSAQLLDDKNQILFATADGITLVYNYYFNRWSTFVNQFSVDSAVWDSKYIYMNTSNVILKENPLTHLDDGTPFQMKIGTGWIKLGGLQGYQRVYRANILGSYKTRHILRATFYNDYSSIPLQTVEYSPDTILSVDSDFYGDGVYGAADPYGGADNGVYQFSTHISKQKSQAIRVVIEDIIDNGVDYGTGESLSLTGVTFQVGVKKGTNKLKTSKTG